MVSRKFNTLEPLLVPTLRLLVALPLTVILTQLLVGYFVPLPFLGFIAPQSAPTFVAAPFIIAETITLLLLMAPRLATWLSRWYLPIVIFFCTSGPVSSFLMLYIRFQADALAGTTPSRLVAYNFQEAIPMLFFLMIPLIVVAWQYSFRYVMFYAISLAIVEIGVGLVVKFYLDVDIILILMQFAIGRTVVFMANGYLVSRLVASQRQQRAALALANEQLARYALTREQLAISQERNRLARDLHDTLAHYISGLVLELEGTRLLWDINRIEARTTLDGAISTARTGLVETRRALQSLRSRPLVDLGLVGAIRDLAENAAARNEWQLQLNLPASPIVLPAAVDEVIYRVVQEGLTNIERHAEASIVTLSMTIARDVLQLQLEDNGCGFIPTAVDPSSSFGLMGMQERASLVGGTLRVESVIGCGTKLRLGLDGAKLVTDSTAGSHPSALHRQKEFS